MIQKKIIIIQYNSFKITSNQLNIQVNIHLTFIKTFPLNSLKGLQDKKKKKKYFQLVHLSENFLA